MRRLYSALFLRDMPESGLSSTINGSAFPCPPGLSPIIYTDRGDADVDQPGTWLGRPGYNGVDMGLFERWVRRISINDPGPVLLDVEVHGDDWWLVAAMLAAGKRLRPLRRWGFYVGSFVRAGVQAGDSARLLASRDLHPGLVAALRIADFASPETYAVPGEDAICYRTRLVWLDTLLRQHQPVLIPGISPWCAPTKAGAAGDAEADQLCRMDLFQAALTYTHLACDGQGILWGGRNHTQKTNRPWNPDSHAWWWYAQKWLAREVN